MQAGLHYIYRTIVSVLNLAIDIMVLLLQECERNL